MGGLRHGGGGTQIKMESHAAVPGAWRGEQKGDGQIKGGEKRKKGGWRFPIRGVRHKVVVEGGFVI